MKLIKDVKELKVGDKIISKDENGLDYYWFGEVTKIDLKRQIPFVHTKEILIMGESLKGGGGNEYCYSKESLSNYDVYKLTEKEIQKYEDELLIMDI